MMKNVISSAIIISLGSFILGGCGAGIANGDAACDAAKVNFVNKVTITHDNMEGYPGLEEFVRKGFIEPELATEDKCNVAKRAPLQTGTLMAGVPGSDTRVTYCEEFQRKYEIESTRFQMAAKGAMFCFE